MRTVVTEKTVYSFGELSTSSQSRALDNMRDVAIDYGWWEFCYDSAGTAADLLGIADLRITGFNLGQSSYVQYSGNYCYRKGSVRAIKNEYPLDYELQTIAEQLQRAQRKANWKAAAWVRPSNRTSLDVTLTSLGAYGCLSDQVSESVEDLMKDFGNWIFSRLEREYDYLTSDDSIREFIEGNEYEFDEDGRQ